MKMATEIYGPDNMGGQHFLGHEKSARDIKFRLFSEIWQSSQLAGRQAAMLFQEQEGQYVPFLSSATNQALANHVQAIKATVDTLKALEPSQPNILINNNLTQQTVAMITPYEATKLIEEKVKGLGIGTEAHMAFLDEGLEGLNLPDIVANPTEETSLTVTQRNNLAMEAEDVEAEEI